MPKKRRRRNVKRPAAPEPQAEAHRETFTATEVNQALADLRSYFEDGKESREDYPVRAPYGSNIDSHLRKARVFAGVYNERDLVRLEALCRKHKMALGPAHIDRLVTIHDRKARQAFEVQVIASWAFRSTMMSQICCRNAYHWPRSTELKSMTSWRWIWSSQTTHSRIGWHKTKLGE